MLVFIAGKSCSGKNSLKELLVSERGYIPLIRETTRAKRSFQDNDYNFITKESFLEKLKKGEYIESIKYYMADENCVYYGTDKKETLRALKSDKIYVTEGSLEAFLFMTSELSEEYMKKLFLCYLTVTPEEQVKRYLSRCKSDGDYLEMCRRIYQESKDYQTSRKILERQILDKPCHFLITDNADGELMETLDKISHAVDMVANCVENMLEELSYCNSIESVKFEVENDKLYAQIAKGNSYRKTLLANVEDKSPETIKNIVSAWITYHKLTI